MIDTVYTCPFTVVTDTREQDPYTFRYLNANWDHDKGKAIPAKKRGLMEVKTVTKGLKTGDYSIEGMEDQIVIERKSLSDLFVTVGQGRSRFEAEHKRMETIIRNGGVGVVIVEGSLTQCIIDPPAYSKLRIESLDATRRSWFCKYRVPWFFCDSRELAEQQTFRLLDTFYRLQLKEMWA